MIILFSVLGMVLLVFMWVVVAPLTICLDTNQPAAIFLVELKGMMKYRVYVQNGTIYFHSHILFFSSEKELFKKIKTPVDRKKKLAGERPKKRGLKLECQG